MTPLPDPTFFILVHLGHGNIGRELALHGVQSTRMLNVTGRWSGGPTDEVPVLVWGDPDEAAKAAEVCGRHRKTSVTVSTLRGTGFAVGKNLVPFGPAHEAALSGYLPYGPTAERKAELERLKALACAAYLVGKNDGDETLLGAARSLSPRAVSGSVDYLTGRRGRAMAQAIIDGEVSGEPGISGETVARGVELAQNELAARLGAQLKPQVS